MKVITWLKLEIGIVIGAAGLLALGPATIAHAQTNQLTKLTTAEIFQRSREAYASLASYSDEGNTISTLGTAEIAQTTFAIKLARPNLYRIEWQQQVTSSYKNKGVVWSAGNGDFMVMGDGDAQKETGKEMALGGATGISGGAAATIPGTFFKMNWGNQLGLSILDEKQQADEKVGDVDCYVFINELKGMKRTLWIGKKDFLIHQVRTVTNAAALKAALAEAAKRNPAMPAHEHLTDYQDAISTETHMNIVVNRQIPSVDFKR